jgi:hypothetical protein
MPLSETQQKILKIVVRQFLDLKMPTERDFLVRKFEDPVAVDQLFEWRLFRSSDAAYFLPTALAFHYCGEPEIEATAKHSVTVMAKVLRSMFLGKIPLSPENLLSEARKVEPQFGEQGVRLGLYLAPDFRLLAGSVGGSTQQPDITPTGISEQVVTLKNPDTLWENYVKTNAVPWPASESSDDDAIEAEAAVVYNEQLANDILASLKVLFPRTTSALHHKSQNPKFTEVSDKEWLLTLDGLEKRGFIKGNPIRTGLGPKLREIYTLEITNEGLVALQQTLQTPRLYYWALSQAFGRASWSRWAKTLVASAVTGGVGYFVQHDPQPISKETILPAVLGAGIYLFFDLLSSSWRLHKSLNNPEPRTTSYGAGIAGIVLLVFLIAGGLTSVYFNLAPKKHKYAIDPTDMNYINASNTLGAFQTLATSSPTCFVRVTAPFENRGIRDVLNRLAVVYCKIDKQPDPAGLQEDVLKGSVDNGIVIHMAKEPQIRDGFITEMRSAFSVRRTYELPPGSPPDLIWIQVGRGYPFKRDDGRSGIE